MAKPRATWRFRTLRRHRTITARRAIPPDTKHSGAQPFYCLCCWKGARQARTVFRMGLEFQVPLDRLADELAESHFIIARSVAVATIPALLVLESSFDRDNFASVTTTASVAVAYEPAIILSPSGVTGSGTSPMVNFLLLFMNHAPLQPNRTPKYARLSTKPGLLLP